jgi:WhiB family redox-sensing transcriptional regulator
MTKLILPGKDIRAEWVSEAQCRSLDPEELFVSGAAQRKAAVICRHCPVIAECGAEALDNREEFGVWGGMTERQRKALLMQHPEVVSWREFIV